jgi:hypothetical protein
MLVFPSEVPPDTFDAVGQKPEAAGKLMASLAETALGLERFQQLAPTPDVVDGGKRYFHTGAGRLDGASVVLTVTLWQCPPRRTFVGYFLMTRATVKDFQRARALLSSAKCP